MTENDIDEMYSVLLEYIERYGLSDRARELFRGLGQQCKTKRDP
jgi:hypothetical protein